MFDSTVPPKRSPFRLSSIPLSIKITAVYLVVGCLWIFLSDSLLLLLTNNSTDLSSLQTIKGLVYVAITAGLGYFLIQRDFSAIQRSNQALQQSYEATLEGWTHALDLRDKETEGHTQRVTELTLRLARMMGMDEAALEQVRRGALLHDIGKIGVPDRILLKPDALSQEEWEIMHKHPDYAYELLSPITYLRSALDIPYCHHEKWDGTGYPRHLEGEQIPLAARLFAVVDVWDALRCDRPYRAGWTEEKTIEYIRSQSGTHFDPKVVEIFFQVIGEADSTLSGDCTAP